MQLTASDFEPACALADDNCGGWLIIVGADWVCAAHLAAWERLREAELEAAEAEEDDS